MGMQPSPLSLGGQLLEDLLVGGQLLQEEGRHLREGREREENKAVTRQFGMLLVLLLKACQRAKMHDTVVPDPVCS